MASCVSAGSPHIPSSLPDTGPGDRQTDSTDGALRAALQALAATSQDGTPLLETREVPPPPQARQTGSTSAFLAGVSSPAPRKRMGNGNFRERGPEQL